MALGFLLLSGCTPKPAIITVDNLYGTWQPDGAASVHQFNDDGTYKTFSNKFVLEDDPIESGQFQLEGILLTLTSSDESRVCTGNKSGIYEVEMTEAGQLQFTSIEDECLDRRLTYTAAPFSRISP